jgi:hypothetical protein
MIRAGIINANINNSKYLSIIDGCGEDDCDVELVVLAALWILNPKINDDVATKKETSVRRFCVIAGTIAIGAPRLVSSCSVTALASSMHIHDTDNSIMKNVNNNKMLK